MAALEHWREALQAFIAALCLWSLLGFASAIVARYISTAAPLRTALITGFAFAAAWCGRQWERKELVWLTYPLLAAAGIKLVMEDLPEGRSLNLVLSLLFLGAALVVLPRVLRRRTPEPVDSGQTSARSAGAD
jgi:hypothetical protein